MLEGMALEWTASKQAVWIPNRQCTKAILPPGVGAAAIVKSATVRNNAAVVEALGGAPAPAEAPAPAGAPDPAASLAPAEVPAPAEPLAPAATKKELGVEEAAKAAPPKGITYTRLAALFNKNAED